MHIRPFEKDHQGLVKAYHQDMKLDTLMALPFTEQCPGYRIPQQARSPHPLHPSKLHSITHYHQNQSIPSSRPLRTIQSMRHGPRGRTQPILQCLHKCRSCERRTVRRSPTTLEKELTGMACRSCLSSSTVSVHTTARFRRQGKDRLPKWSSC